MRVLCAATGDRIPHVFFVDTRPEGAAPALGRFLTAPDGSPMVSPVRRKRMVPNGRGGQKLEVYFDRLEVWERRPWVAVDAAGAVVAKSEDAP